MSLRDFLPLLFWPHNITMKLKVAALTTVYHPNSHADVIVSRWLQPRLTDVKYEWSAQHSEIASMCIAQFPPHTLWKRPSAHTTIPLRDYDLGRCMAEQFDVPLFSTIREALTQGTGRLAVDAVLLIGEHGNYPYNEIGQKMYPRREMFDEIVAVLREAGRVVPIFIDKHYSYDTESIHHMVNTAQELGIPIFAGSSLPYNGFCESESMPTGQALEEAVAVFNVGPEAYGFHSLEMMQAVIEQRPEGESGVSSICAYARQGVWDAVDKGEIPAELLESALAKCRSASAGDMQENCKPSLEDGGQTCPISPVAFCLERRDGLRDSHVMLQGHIEEFALAVRTKSDRQIYGGSSRLYGPEEFFAHFAILCAVIEQFFVTGQPPVPPERTLLTSLTMAALMEALQRPGQRIVTPQLEMAYRPQQKQSLLAPL